MGNILASCPCRSDMTDKAYCAGVFASPRIDQVETHTHREREREREREGGRSIEVTTLKDRFGKQLIRSSTYNHNNAEKSVLDRQLSDTSGVQLSSFKQRHSIKLTVCRTASIHLVLPPVRLEQLGLACFHR